MSVKIETILEDLKSGKGSRTCKSLDKLNAILKNYTNNGGENFSITAIGKISYKHGGPTYETIRATKNAHYRELINAWSIQSVAANKNNKTAKNIQINNTNVDFKLLELLEDVPLRVAFGQIIAERNKYKKELNILKANAYVTIDKRPNYTQHEKSINSLSVVEVNDDKLKLTLSEKEALNYALSQKCLDKNFWFSTNAGQVKEIDSNHEIFPRGFLTGLKKLLQN